MSRKESIASLVSKAVAEIQRPAPVVVVPPNGDGRRPHEFATRNCVHCAGELPEGNEEVACPECKADSVVLLCDHTAPKPSWRITRWQAQRVPHAKRAKDVIAVAVGDVTVFIGRYRDVLSIRGEDGTRLPFQRVRSIEPGSEIIERLTHIGNCYRCAVAFFLPDCEITSRGVPRILRVPLDRPTRQYMKPTPDPARLSTAYLELGHHHEEDDDERVDP